VIGAAGSAALTLVVFFAVPVAGNWRKIRAAWHDISKPLP
jgi:hypothetical protein